MEKMMLLDTIYSTSWASFSVTPVTMVQSWRKFLPDLDEDDLQGFPNKEFSKSKILDIVCAMRSSENTDKYKVEEWLHSDACEMGFQSMPDITNVLMKEKGEEEGENDENEIHTTVHKNKQPLQIISQMSFV
jgi:hypothetical protein